ncbi:MAG: heavy metal translocating P-type ATPase [Coriobacteriia bacterium]|nr:heavy metal translocating P-type ATPase [Coriobacteriia bacterium]
MSASVARIEGVLSADLNFASATLLVEYDPAAAPLARVVSVVESTGHGIAPLDDQGETSPVPARPWLDRHLAGVAALGSGVFSAVGALLGVMGASDLASSIAFAIAILFGGLLIWRRAVVSLRARVLDMNVLMSVAVVGAVALGEWGEAATVFFLFCVGGLLESRSLERTRRSIRDLMDLSPATARVRRGEALVQIGASEVMIGETVTVRPGERVPLDGDVVAGFSAVDESAITGESIPAEKTLGDRVFGGTLNTSGLIEVRVTALAADSTLARIVHLVEEAQASRAPSQRFIDRFSRIYTPTVIVLAALVAVVPPLLGAIAGIEGISTAEWVNRALVVLVVACPCALVISTPVSIVSGITRATRDGVLVKGGVFLEAAAKVRAVAFDKTGTLTAGVPEVRRVVASGPLGEGGVLAVAAALEFNSSHPVARAVVRAAQSRNITWSEAGAFTETPGLGVSGVVDGVHYAICSPVRALEIAEPEASTVQTVAAIEDDGMTVLVVVGSQRIVGLIAVADTVRPEGRAAVEALRRGGIEHLVMLTGDNDRVARAVAEHAGLSEFRARLMPEDKTAAVSELANRYGTVAMVGDGVNDAPALAAATIGIAMGAAGSDTALETADVALMRDDLSALPGFFALGRRTMRVIAQNITASILIKVVFLALALTGQATLWMAVFADTGVALLVILNGMRLLRPLR